MKTSISILLGAVGVSIATTSCSNDIMEKPMPDNYASRTISLTGEEREVADRSNKFAWNLLTECMDGKEDANVVVSPMSANICFSILANAANGETRNQILDALGFADMPMVDVNSYNKKLSENICRLDDYVELLSANSFWYDNALNPKKEFVGAIRSNYNVEMFEINHSSFAQDVNKWCSRNTKGLIDRVLNDDTDLDFAFINALYFKGMWHPTCKFDKEYTRQDIFTNFDGSESTVDFMRKKDRYAYYNSAHWRAVSIGFGGGGYRYIAILPDEGVSMNECLNEVPMEYPRIINNAEIKSLDLMLPKYKMRSETNLVDVMKKMGMTNLFDVNKIDLSNLTDMGVIIKLAKQNVSFEINEDGAEAAAVTIVGGLETSAGPEVDGYELFHINRPFIYMIVERSTGTILFLGCMNKF